MRGRHARYGRGMGALTIVVDGHTHIFNRVCWEHIDPWQPQPFGFDFARAFASGVNVIIETSLPTATRTSPDREADPAPGRNRPPLPRAARRPDGSGPDQ